MPSQRRASNKRPPRPPTKKTSPSGADPTAAATPAAASSDTQVPSTATAVDDDGFGSSTDDAVAEAAAGADTGTTDGAAGNGATVGETAGNGGRAAEEASNAGGDSASIDSGAGASGNGVALSTNGDEGLDEDPSAIGADDLPEATDQIPDTPAPAAAATTEADTPATAAAATGTPRTPTATDKPRPTKTISPTSKTLSPTSKTLSPTSKALSSSNKPPAGTAKSGQAGATGKGGNQTNGAPANSGSPRSATKAPATKSPGAGKAATGKGGSSTSTQPAPKSPRPKAGTGGPAYRPPTGQARTASRRPPPAKRKKSRFTKKTISAVVGLCLIAAIVVFFALAVNGSGTGSTATIGETGPENIPIPSGPTLAAPAASSYGPTIDGIQCQTSEQLAYHIHVHLTIFVNGKAQQIPYGIGIAPPVHTTTQSGGAFVDGGSCYYWLHTHSPDGIIHIESPTSTIYTLGVFFDIWGQTLSANQVGPALGKVTVYQNGKLYTGDPRQVMLSAHNQIQLDVGTNTPPKPLLSSWGSL